MQKIAAFLFFALLSEAAFAQGSCSFTYNRVSGKIDMRCQGGMATAPLNVPERALLITGKAKVCVVRANPERTAEALLSD